MGYSIGFTPRSGALGKRVLALMRESYRSWPDVAKVGGGPYAGAPADDLSYCSKGVIGVDYGAVSGWEREYAYAIVRWMAIRAGRRRSSFHREAVVPNRFPAPVPYMMCDRDHGWPILVVSGEKELSRVPKSARWCAFDNLGMRAEPHRAIKEVIFDLRDVDVSRIIGQAEKEEGSQPEDRSRHWDWVDRRDRAMLRLCQKAFDPAWCRMRDELTRLDVLWAQS